MNKLLMIILVGLVGSPLSSLYAQSVDDVVQSYVRFIGGERKWRKIRTMKTTGEYDYGGIVFPFRTVAKAPNKYKVVVPFNGKYFAQACTGDSGWKIDAFKNETTPTMLSGKEARALVNEGRVDLEDPMVGYRKKGNHVSLGGKAACGDGQCFVLDVELADGVGQTWFVSDRDYRLVKVRAVSQNPEMGGSLMDIAYNDYRLVNGVRLPFHVSCKIEDQLILTITVKDVKLNDKVADAIFEPTAAAE